MKESGAERSLPVMECKHFEKLILDYIDGRLDNEISYICHYHLSQCPQCSELNENYKSVRSEIKRGEGESPSEDVLKSIRERAREKGIIKKVPIYKKVLGSPLFFSMILLIVTVITVLYTR